MFKLDKTIYDKAYKLYQKQDGFFPLIADVLLDEQDGVVYGDCLLSPQRVYVEHAFGFAQVFGNSDAAFDSALRHYLIVEKSFTTLKVRLYTPSEPDFLRSSNFDSHRSERQRFVLDGIAEVITDESPKKRNKATRLKPIDKDQLMAVESQFDIVRRFWRNGEDFVAKAHAVVAWQDAEPAAICYAAAIAEGLAEIDVLTAPAYRRIGLGRQVVLAFNKNCIEQGLQPVWDCFTNNAGSMALCQTSGFKTVRPAYSFYTFGK